jgi:hypothetical protein
MNAERMGEESDEKRIFSALSRSEPFFARCMTLSMIEQEWKSIAGEALARRSGPKAYENGVLVVAVENRSAEQDMNFKKNAILKEIRAKTFLKLKDIRTEICRVKRKTVNVARPSLARRKKPRVISGPELEAQVGEIMERNPKLKPETAYAAARCRLVLLNRKG